MHVVGDIVAFAHAVDDHALGHGDHLRHRLVQEADNGPLVAAVGLAVTNEGEQLIGKFFFVGKELENVWHRMHRISKRVVMNYVVLAVYAASEFSVKYTRFTDLLPLL